MKGEDQRLEMLEEQRPGIEEVPRRCELNDIDDLEGKQECFSVDRVVDRRDGKVDCVLRVILACRCKRANDFRLQTSFR